MSRTTTDQTPGSPKTATTTTERLAKEWLSAGVGCALSDTVFNPLEVLKVRRQIQASSNTSYNNNNNVWFSANGDQGSGRIRGERIVATWITRHVDARVELYRVSDRFVSNRERLLRGEVEEEERWC